MGLLGKVKQWAGQNAGQVGKRVDTAAQKADQATGGKYSERINQAAEKVKGYAAEGTGEQTSNTGETGGPSAPEQQGETSAERPDQHPKPDSGPTS